MHDGSPARRRTAILPAALALAAAGGLGGCSGGADYPSLASRPAERLTEQPQPSTSAAPAADRSVPSDELAARLNHLVEQASRAHRDFDEQRPAAERLIQAAGSAPAGSEDWARATQALSGVQAARSLTAQPLAEIDRIDVEDHIAHAAQDGPNADHSPRADALAIAHARTAVSVLVAQEDAALATLDGRLAR